MKTAASTAAAPSATQPVQPPRGALPTAPGSGGPPPVEPPPGNGNEGTGGTGGDSGSSFVIVFASNLTSQGGCHDGDVSGCDLFIVNYDAAKRTVDGLKQVVADPRQAEWAPAISPDGCWLAYNTSNGAGAFGSAITHIASGATSAIPGSARFPTWASDGKSLAWSVRENGADAVYVAGVNASCAEGNVAVASTQPVLPQKDRATGASFPRFFPGGNQLALQVGSLPGSRLGTALPDGNGPAALEGSDGLTFPALRPDGAAVIAANPAARTISIMDRTSQAAWSAPRTVVPALTPAAAAEFDPRYAACATLTPAYPDWMGAGAILYSVECGLPGAAAFSHLFAATVTASGATDVVDIGSLIEQLAGASSKDFMGAVAFPLQGGERSGRSFV